MQRPVRACICFLYVMMVIVNKRHNKPIGSGLANTDLVNYDTVGLAFSQPWIFNLSDKHMSQT